MGWVRLNESNICICLKCQLSFNTVSVYMYVLTSVCACVCPLGFQVVGGEESGRTDPGTIISSITPGGPADLNGCLNPGRPHSPRSLYFCEQLRPPCLNNLGSKVNWHHVLPMLFNINFD